MRKRRLQNLGNTNKEGFTWTLNKMNAEYQERLRQIRIRYPKAYTVWSKHDDKLLEQQFKSGKKLEALSAIFQRRPSAIKSRLRKLGFPTVHEFQRPVDTNNLQFSHKQNAINTSIHVNLSLEWRIVLQNEGEKYVFPNPITSFMKRHYGSPAIYRWKKTQHEGTFSQPIYIGTTNQLCPDRLNGYLNPRSSQTNTRLHEQFHAMLQQGFQIDLDILDVHQVFHDDLGLTLYDVDTKVRLVVEKLLIAYYQQKGVSLLNL